MNRSLLAIAIAFFAIPPLPAQTPHTVLDGVYTAAQAERGEGSYQTKCAGCHGDTLYGRAMGALRGDVFLDLWREESLSALYDHIKTRMPAGDPGSLSDSTYLDIVAYILKVNTYPAGSQDLTTATVANTLFVGKDGPQPLATNTIVAVIGCMEKSPDGWSLRNATPAVREEKPDEITATDRKTAAARPLGAREYDLRNLDEMPAGFDAAAHSSQKVEAKGVLVRSAKRDRIHVMSLDTVAQACRP